MGNSALKLGIFKGKKLVKRTAIARASAQKMARAMATFLKGKEIRGAVFCSVVPAMTTWLKRELRRAVGSRALEVTHHLELGLKVRARPASGVGTDRLANAVAACLVCRLPCVVIDFGTATTYDVVSAKREYLGGVITPGLRSSVEMLAGRAAQLPLVSLRRPKKVVGSNTQQAMLSGLVNGQIGQVKGILRQIGMELGEKPMVVATGGLARLVAAMGAPIKRVDADLTLKGLRIIHELNS